MIKSGMLLGYKDRQSRDGGLKVNKKCKLKIQQCPRFHCIV